MKIINNIIIILLFISCASNPIFDHPKEVKPYLTMLKKDRTLSPTEKERLKVLSNISIKIVKYQQMSGSNAVCWMNQDVNKRRIEFVQESFLYPKSSELWNIKKMNHLPKFLKGSSLKVKRKYLLIKRTVLDCLNPKLKRNGKPFITINKFLWPKDNLRDRRPNRFNRQERAF